MAALVGVKSAGALAPPTTDRRWKQQAAGPTLPPAGHIGAGKQRTAASTEAVVEQSIPTSRRLTEEGREAQ